MADFDSQLSHQQLTKLYSDTKRSCEAVIEPTQQLSDTPELTSLHRRLRIQKDRLVSWGLEWAEETNSAAAAAAAAAPTSIEPGQADNKSIDESVARAGMTEVVTHILENIKDILHDADILRSQSATGPSPLGQEQHQAIKKGFGMDVNPGTGALADLPRKSMDRKPPARWPLADKARYNDLIRDLTASIDVLYDLSLSRKRMSQQKMELQQQQLQFSQRKSLEYAAQMLSRPQSRSSWSTRRSYPTTPYLAGLAKDDYRDSPIMRPTPVLEPFFAPLISDVAVPDSLTSSPWSMNNPHSFSSTAAPTLVSHGTSTTLVSVSDMLPADLPPILTLDMLKILEEELPPSSWTTGVPFTSRVMARLPQSHTQQQRRRSTFNLSLKHNLGKATTVPVLVEYAQYRNYSAGGSDVLAQGSSEAFGTSESDSAIQPISRLEQFLELIRRPADLPEVSRLCTLNCLGYFKDPDRPRFGLVYELPFYVHAYPAEARRSMSDLRPITLMELLLRSSASGFTGSSALVPSLEDRFRLAFRLGQAFSRLHELNFLHKNVNSGNVLIFRKPLNSAPSTSIPDLSSPEPSNYAISSPFLSFDLFSDLLTPSNPAINIYRHRHDQATNTHNSIRSNIQFDIYGLGLILLEIGLWMPLAEMHQAGHSDDFDFLLKDRWSRQLAATCGTVYMRAVQSCISYVGPDMGAPEPDQLRWFYGEILGRLRRCTLLDDCQPVDDNFFDASKKTSIQRTSILVPTLEENEDEGGDKSTDDGSLPRYSSDTNIQKLLPSRETQPPLPTTKSDSSIFRSGSFTSFLRRLRSRSRSSLADHSEVEPKSTSSPSLAPSKAADQMSVQNSLAPSVSRNAATTIAKTWRAYKQRADYSERRRKVILLQSKWRQGRKVRQAAQNAPLSAPADHRSSTELAKNRGIDGCEVPHQRPALQQATARPKLRVHPIKLTTSEVDLWHRTLLPRLERILESSLPDPNETVTIDLLYVGEDRATAKLTIFVTCTSTTKVRAILRKKFKYDQSLMDLKVRKGKVRRSKLKNSAATMRSIGNQHSSQAFGDQALFDDADDDIAPQNPFFYQRPTCGSSIGAYIKEHLPPVSYGGVLLVDGQPYGMSVHHLLDAPSDSSDDELDEEDTRNNDHCEPGRSAAEGGFRTGSRLQRFTSSRRGSSYRGPPNRQLPPVTEAPEVSDFYEISDEDEGYEDDDDEDDVDADDVDDDDDGNNNFADGSGLLSGSANEGFDVGDANSIHRTRHRYPSIEADIGAPAMNDGYDRDEGKDIHDDENSDAEIPGDVPGVAVGKGTDITVTQPALQDVSPDFFSTVEDRDDEHLSSHTLGHIYATSGIRRWRRDGIAHEIDWSLFKLQSHRLQPCNLVIGGRRFFPQTCRQSGHQLFEPVLRRHFHQDDDEFPSHIANSKSLGGLQVHCFGRTSGLQGGFIGCAMSSVKIYRRRTFSRSWHVLGGFGMGGDSGAWVIDNKAGQVCGHVLAWCDRNEIAYICPMDVLLADMRRKLGADNICLPGGEETRTRGSMPPPVPATEAIALPAQSLPQVITPAMAEHADSSDDDDDDDDTTSNDDDNVASARPSITKTPSPARRNRPWNRRRNSSPSRSHRQPKQPAGEGRHSLLLPLSVKPFEEAGQESGINIADVRRLTIDSSPGSDGPGRSVVESLRPRPVAPVGADYGA